MNTTYEQNFCTVRIESSDRQGYVFKAVGDHEGDTCLIYSNAYPMEKLVHAAVTALRGEPGER